MNRRTRYLIFLAVVMCAFSAKLPHERRTPADHVSVELTAETPPAFHHQQPVGWVFGRLIGLPGADRPMTSPMLQSNGPGLATRPQLDR